MGPFSAVEKPELLDLPEQMLGAHIKLRAYRAGDGAAFFAAVDQHREELLKWMAWPSHHQTVENSESYVRRMAADFMLRKSLTMSLWLRTDGSFLGASGFHAPDWSTPKAEIGYFLSPPARRKGYAREALGLTLRFGFEHARLNRIFGQCDSLNVASIAVMRAAGMRQEAYLHCDARDHHGCLRDTLVFALSATDWPLSAEHAHDVH